MKSLLWLKFGVAALISVTGGAVVMAGTFICAVAAFVLSMSVYDLLVPHDVHYGKNWPISRVLTALISLIGGFIAGIIGMIRICISLAPRLNRFFR
ncbi:hypothetical protein [Methylobacterium sp. 77]|uniref:hypothetical protein n=1 Tax=Methylobacterium sp. 77 TaxID=1101192 RepID=UPI00037A8367|nr:hypothetical protein [Methylobacterium sp. 77]